MKDQVIFFNEFVIELLEDFFKLYLDDILLNLNKFNNLKDLFNLLIICYEIYIAGLINNENYFSNKFLKLLKNIDIWISNKFWISFFDYMIKLCSKNDMVLYFTNFKYKSNLY